MRATLSSRSASADRNGSLSKASDFDGAFALLAEMTSDFAASLDVEKTLERALEMIVAHIEAEAGSLWLANDAHDELTCHASVGPNQITGMRLPMTQGIVGRSVRENLCQRVFDVSQDPHFASSLDEHSGFVTRSLLCAPMRFGEEPLGAIEVVNKRGGDGRFAENDVALLQALASSAGLAIANARMAKSLVDHERVRRELELAAEIQRSLLPPPREGLPVFGVNVPARTVSGDFFDILPLPDGRIGFCLGDVSGKGMNAALLMAKTASLYRCLAKSVERPGRLLGVLNDEISETATRGMFVTMVAGVFDPSSGYTCLSNAGHEPPLCHFADGRFDTIPADAPPLGIAAGIAGDGFPEVDVEIAGGALYVFSDGLTEACSEGGDLLGSQGARDLIERFVAKPLADRIRAIVADAGRLELRDDLTLLGLDAVGARRP